MIAMNGASHQSVTTRRVGTNSSSATGTIHERQEQAQRQRDLDEGEDDPREPDDDHAASVGHRLSRRSAAVRMDAPSGTRVRSSVRP